jgi:hypothetical protein
MLPIGEVESTVPTRFTKTNKLYPDEHCGPSGRSPLIFGGDMTKLDAFTKEMLTNPEMLKVITPESHNNKTGVPKEQPDCLDGPTSPAAKTIRCPV